MPDGSTHVDFTEWRVVRLPKDGPIWPFLELDVGESFVESDVSKWPSLRTKASILRRKYLDRDMDRAWAVRKENHSGNYVIVVRRTA